jgi:hypothetical protein
VRLIWAVSPDFFYKKKNNKYVRSPSPKNIKIWDLL